MSGIILCPGWPQGCCTVCYPPNASMPAQTTACQHKRGCCVAFLLGCTQIAGDTQQWCRSSTDKARGPCCMRQPSSPWTRWNNLCFAMHSCITCTAAIACNAVRICWLSSNSLLISRHVNSGENKASENVSTTTAPKPHRPRSSMAAKTLRRLHAVRERLATSSWWNPDWQDQAVTSSKAFLQILSDLFNSLTTSKLM